MKNKTNNAMFNKLVNNKITLYIVSIIALLSLIGHIIYSEISAIILFFLVGAIAYNFTKNMTIVLGSAFVVTSIASMTMNLFVYQEGMEGNDSSGNTNTSTNARQNNVASALSNSRDSTDSTDNTNSTNSTNTNSTNTNSTNTNSRNTNSTNTNSTNSTDDTEGLSQLTPALLDNIPNKEQMQKQLGKATEMEQAYDNLEKIMGKENIQSISTDTKDLIKQQNDLIKQLKTMTPALNDAMSSLGNLDLSKLTNMFSSATKSLSEMKA
uniref:Uncharacterized protein n=1 Tax=viral metagenome TaxID=1070528 RepID=A0A6C0H4P3_9ZZZZ